ncbi:PREDICTED: transcription factor TFIIIB component B'' homolog [Papilio xuthus]|uniref:Transcription factor TFIIIB component B'' homolog n=1 Tax=Papilio xuthus TaxID=66420 RepID=A0AAJ7E4U9_PAPXU|nr:PREDICTED: transcription factor TFIIIB component B'' homolog [Papilio xuthus]
MSTRRARIKAVTSLPPRRKNAETADVKNKPAQVKENVEKSLKSPRTPRPLAEKNEVDDTAVLPNTSVEVTNATEYRSVIITPNKNAIAPNTVASPINPTEKIKASPKSTEKVSSNATSVIKSNKIIFASPQTRRDSPFRKAIASLLTSPKNTTKSADVNQTKSPSPQINKHTPKQQIINDNNELHITNKNIHKVTHNIVSPVGSNTTEDFNVPSVPESVNDETVMDGIVPLQQAGNVPKPIDILKSEIISENVEVLFDPIVPLPSPSKVRPKLRPAPRLGPHRRNSIQGSASESEDETRRAQLSSGAATPSLGRQRHDSHTSSTLINREVNRVRNDSVCSSASQLTAPSVVASPLKEKQSKLRRQEAANRRAAAMRRKREKAAAKRESLTMYDLIFYNPTTNPIVPDQDELKAKEENAKDAKESAAKAEESKSKEQNNTTEETAPAPAPQIKLGPNGEIVLDEQSLVIKPSDSGRSISCVVREGAWGGGGGAYRRATRTADWSAQETVRFYRAIAAIGTDFTLMAHLFPDRSRKDLKLKFKKEERQNGVLVDKALRSAGAWDAEALRGEFESERAEAKRRAAAERARLARTLHAERDRVRTCRDLRVRNSKGGKALESTMIPGITQLKENELTTADEIIARAKQTKPIGLEDVFVETQAPPAPVSAVNNKTTPKVAIPRSASANVTPNANAQPAPATLNKSSATPAVPNNIETGSLVVLTVNDPSSPSKKMLQTYIAHGGGRLTPVSLPTTLLNSVVGYMKKGTPKNTTTTGSPHFASPSSVTSQESRGSSTPGVIQVNPSPTKRQRLSSYTITQI